MIIFGTRSKVLGGLEVQESCPHCGKSQHIGYAVQKYFHIYWIPCFPLGRNFGLDCQHCHRLSSLSSDTGGFLFRRLKDQFSTPLYIYTGAVLLAGFALIIKLSPR